jgi:carbamoyl-phosphate synthase large subunit
MNVQYAVKDGEVYILEVNPLGSSTVPFVSKVLGAALTKIATKAMLGMTLQQQNFTKAPVVPYVAVKESVFPFAKFHGVDTLLSPEMKSTGEVMGIDTTAARAFAKAQIAAGNTLPQAGSGGQVFLSLNDRDKDGMVPIARELERLGFDLLATAGTTKRLRAEGIACRELNKVSQGSPHIVDLIQSKQCAMLINTPQNRASVADDGQIRKAALLAQIPYTTTLSGARAAVAAIAGLVDGEMGVKSLQEYHAGL